MATLKQTLYATVVPALVTASFGFAGAAFAAGSSSGNMNQGQMAGQSGMSSGAMSMSAQCKKNPSSSNCMKEHHSSSDMTSGSAMSGNSDSMSHSMSGSGGHAMSGKAGSMSKKGGSM